MTESNMERILKTEKILMALRINLSLELNHGNPQEQDQAAGAYFLIDKLDEYVEELRKRYEQNP